MPLHALSSGPDDSGPDARWERPKPVRNYLLKPAYREVSQAKIYALSEPATVRMLADMRWALDGKQVCPECGTIDTHYWSKRLLRWQCRSKVCRKQFSMFSGTKLHGTKMPAKQVLSFLLDFVEAKDGISARELSGRHDRDHQTMHVMSMKVNTYGYTHGNPLSLVDVDGLRPDLNLFHPKDKMYWWAESIPPIAGVFQVVGHREPFGVDATINGQVRRLNGKQLADLVRKSGWKPGTPVLLQSCNTGASSNGVAQQVSTELEVPVYAPKTLVWLYPPVSHRLTPAPVPSNFGEEVPYAIRKLSSPDYRLFIPAPQK